MNVKCGSKKYYLKFSIPRLLKSLFLLIIYHGKVETKFFKWKFFQSKSLAEYKREVSASVTMKRQQENVIKYLHKLCINHKCFQVIHKLIKLKCHSSFMIALSMLELMFLRFAHFMRLNQHFLMALSYFPWALKRIFSPNFYLTNFNIYLKNYLCEVKKNENGKFSWAHANSCAGTNIGNKSQLCSVSWEFSWKK